MSNERELIDFKEVAAMLGGVHPEHVRKRISKRADFPTAFRIGTLVKFDRSEVAAWVEDQRQSAMNINKNRRA